MREQAYRDPVHDFITITDESLLQLIDTTEFQRLRRVRQLGASYGTYHGAEQSRFGHSLGSMWIMRRILDRLTHIGVNLEEHVYITALCAALLHDIGHGPFSHALEGHLTPGVSHEEWGIRILLEETDVHRLLAQVDLQLPQLVASVLAGSYQGPSFVQELVSSQLDVDRMDYLLRDSLYTGVTYGQFDLQRVINTLSVIEGRVVIAAKGVVAIEEYVLARYFMYWQVYLHKATRIQELILRAAWRRATELHREGRLALQDSCRGVRPFLSGNHGLGAYLDLDDYELVASLKAWQRHGDPVLADLSARFLDRDLLKPVFKVPHVGDIAEGIEAAKGIVEDHGWDPSYYVVVDQTSDIAYDIYTEDELEAGVECGKTHKPPILALDEYGRPTEITKLSETIRAVACRPRQAVNIYVPKETLSTVRALFLS